MRVYKEKEMRKICVLTRVSKSDVKMIIELSMAFIDETVVARLAGSNRALST